MRVTVTGGTGTIGLAVVKMLVQAGHAVRAVVRRPDEFQDRCRDDRVEINVGDMEDRTMVAAALEGADAAIHCVAFPPDQFKLNWDTTRFILESLRPGAQFVMPGDASVFGFTPPGERVGPRHPKASPARRGVVRADLERAILAERGTVIHLPEVFGPGVVRGRVVDIFQRALSGRTVWFPGDLDRPREYLYIEDAARALIAPLGRPSASGAEYTAPGFAAITPREFVSLVFKAVGQAGRLRSLPETWLRLAALLTAERRATRDLLYLQVRPLLFDGSQIRQDLGWTPEVDYADAVRRTVKWLRSEEGETAMQRDRRRDRSGGD
jgi:nucleoside-diphosphate-sugar epimerase